MAEFNNGRPEPTFQKEKYIWLRDQLYLDLLLIDEEIQKMPSLIQEAGELAATAIEIRESGKEELDKVLANAADQLRNTPNLKGKDRSETAIASEVHLSPNVIAHKERLGDARHDAALWSSLVEALRRKDSAIRVVADLLNSGFLTTSSIMDKRRKEIRARTQSS